MDRTSEPTFGPTLWTAMVTLAKSPDGSLARALRRASFRYARTNLQATWSRPLSNIILTALRLCIEGAIANDVLNDLGAIPPRKWNAAWTFD